MKLTVAEYAKMVGNSTQAVYKKIANQLLTTVKEGGITYIVVDAPTGSEEPKEQVANDVADQLQEVLNLVADQLQEIKRLGKEVKRLSKSLEKCNKTKEGVFLQYITELKQLQIGLQSQEPTVAGDDDVIDVPNGSGKKKHEKTKKQQKQKKKKKK